MNQGDVEVSLNRFLDDLFMKDAQPFEAACRQAARHWAAVIREQCKGASWRTDSRSDGRREINQRAWASSRKW